MSMRSELSDIHRVKPPVKTGKPAQPATLPSASQPARASVSSSPTRDTFLLSPPGQEDLARWSASIQILEHLPPVPADVRPKRAWLKEQTPRLEVAEESLTRLTEARFDHGVPGDDELMRLTATVQKARDVLRDTRERAGLQAPVPPLDPGRPAFQLTDGANQLAKTPLLSLLGVILIPVALTVDTVDAVTRPVQAARYPAEMNAYRVRLAEYEKARTVPIE